MRLRDGMRTQRTRQNDGMPFITIREVALELHLSKASVQRLVDAGVLHAIDVAPPGTKARTIRIDKAEVARFVAERNIQPREGDR